MILIKVLSTISNYEKDLSNYCILNRTSPIAFAQNVSSVDSLQTQSDALRIAVHFNSPLFILDGVELSLESIKKIDQNDIAELQVLKDAASVASYGEKGKNGVGSNHHKNTHEFLAAEDNGDRLNSA